MHLARYAPSVTADDFRALHLGSLLHDVGKIGIPDAILLKPGRLTPEEMDQIRLHPVIGYDIIRTAVGLEDILPIVRHHHERLDGTGYPDGLKGDQIPFVVRCVSIADVFDAFTSARPYRPKMTPDDAIRLLWDESSKGWWDRDLVAIFDERFKAGDLDDIITASTNSYWITSTKAA
jgi:putative two-component system response regulator